MAKEENAKSHTTSQLIKCTFRWEIDNFSYFCKSNQPISESEKGTFLKSSTFSPVPNPYSMEFHLKLTPYPKYVFEDIHEELEYDRQQSMYGDDSGQARVEDEVNIEVIMTHGRQIESVPVRIKGQMYLLNEAGEKHFCSDLINKYWTFWDTKEALVKIKRTELLNPDINLLTNDKLTIICEINFLANVAINGAMSKVNLNQLCEKAQKLSLDSNRALLDSGKYSDVVVCVDEGENKAKEFRLHKMILSGRSSVFAAMFEHELEETQQNRVHIIDVKVDVFEQLIRYIYYGDIQLLDKYAMELMEAVNKYNLVELKQFCEQFLCLNMSKGFAIDLLVLAEMHNSDELKNCAIECIKRNIISVMKTEKWNALYKNQPKVFEQLLGAFKE